MADVGAQAEELDSEADEEEAQSVLQEVHDGRRKGAPATQRSPGVHALGCVGAPTYCVRGWG